MHHHEGNRKFDIEHYQKVFQVKITLKIGVEKSYWFKKTHDFH